MTLGRVLFLLTVFAALGLTIVHLRTQQTGLAAQIQRHRAERLELRRQSWQLQMEIARLRTPSQIKERIDRWQVEVRAPWPAETNADRSMLARR